jgi:hypothetical protein
LDVNRENGFRAADLVDEAEQIASRPERYDAEASGPVTVSRLLQEARVRAQPLADDDLDDRMRAAVYFCQELLTLQSEPGAARHWLAEATANIRSGLVPHLSAPSLFRRAQPLQRSFPTSTELYAMNTDHREGQVLIGALIAWRAQRTQGV